jgi:uncharacterized protein YbaP (TraB family)
MKRILHAAAMTLLLAGSAAAQNAPPAACEGQDPLAALRVEKPEAYATYKAETARIPNAEGLLWRIEKQNLPPSYLFGTIHMTDSRATELPSQVLEALEESTTVAVELAAVGDETATAQATRALLTRAAEPDSTSPALPFLTDDERHRVVEALGARGMPRQTIHVFKPWFVTMALAIPPCELARKSARLDSVDELIARSARKRGLPVVGLEEETEQLDVITSLAPWILEASLRDLVRSESRNRDLLEMLVSLYVRREVGGLVPAYRQVILPEENLPASIAFIDALMGSRNNVMRDRAQPLLEEGRAFIAVGALHLPGEGGLVELFRKEGYRLTRVW